MARNISIFEKAHYEMDHNKMKKEVLSLTYPLKNHVLDTDGLFIYDLSITHHY